jgi:hypothetical protein
MFTPLLLENASITVTKYVLSSIPCIEQQNKGLIQFVIASEQVARKVWIFKMLLMYFLTTLLSQNTSTIVAKYVLHLVPCTEQQNKGLIQFVIASEQVARKVWIFQMLLMYFLTTLMSENTSTIVTKYVLSLVPCTAQQNKGLIQFIITSDQMPRKVWICRMLLMYFLTTLLSQNTSTTVAKYVLSLVPFAAQQNKGLIQYNIASDQVPRKVQVC